MLSISKPAVENDISFFMKMNGCQEKEQKNQRSQTSHNNAKNEQHKHQVKIYTIITLSFYLIPFSVL